MQDALAEQIGEHAVAVAALAGLMGHELNFVRQTRRRTWVICKRCRISCYMGLASAVEAERSIERWMTRECGSLQAAAEEGHGYQLVQMDDGLRVVFSREVLTLDLMAAVREMEFGPSPTAMQSLCFPPVAGHPNYRYSDRRR